jgi:hypothetical protein
MWEQNEIKTSNKLFPHFTLQLLYYFRNSFPATEHGRHPVHVYVCVCVLRVQLQCACPLLNKVFQASLHFCAPPPLAPRLPFRSMWDRRTAHKIFDTVSFRTQDLTLGPSLYGWCRTAIAGRFCILWARICKVCQNCPTIEICDMNDNSKHMW